MKISTKHTEETNVDMTPMIDIVFQLIAFFMVITNFEQTQADERVKLPRDALAKPPEATNCANASIRSPRSTTRLELRKQRISAERRLPSRRSARCR